MDVTSMPQQFNNVPNELAMTPFPTPLITPPVTKMYFMVSKLLDADRMKRLHIDLSRGLNREKLKCEMRNSEEETKNGVPETKWRMDADANSLRLLVRFH